MISLLLALGYVHYNCASRPNVLMIAIDDLRPQLGCYGCTDMITPAIDNLAEESLVYDRAYVSVALCSPSRTALLTSRRPDTSRVWEIKPYEYWRISGGNFTTLPQYFKEHDYLTLGMGKVFHPGAPSGYMDVKYSWSPECLPYRSYYLDPLPGLDVPLWHAYKVPIEEMGERKLARLAEKYIRDIKINRTEGIDTRPFFLAVGFHRPHIPWYAPESFFNMYPTTNMSLAPNVFIPAYVPKIALQNQLHGWRKKFTDLWGMYLGDDYPYDNVTASPEKALLMRQAYFASTSYTDSNVGLVMQALKAHGFDNNTIVVLWGDHGFQLGDNNEWGKMDNFEHATRVPWMIKLPTQYPPFAKFEPGRSSEFIEEVDLFPTLVDLAFGSPIPPCNHNVTVSRKTEICTEGLSFKDTIFNPTAPFKKEAFSQFNRHSERYMGFSIRTNKYRYTEWVKFDNKSTIPFWNENYGTELYIHENAVPGPCQWDYEHTNVAHFPEYKNLTNQLSKRLHAGWKGAAKHLA